MFSIHHRLGESACISNFRQCHVHEGQKRLAVGREACGKVDSGALCRRDLASDPDGTPVARTTGNGAGVILAGAAVPADTAKALKNAPPAPARVSR